MRGTSVSCHGDGEIHSIRWRTLRMVTWLNTAIAGCCEYGNEHNLPCWLLASPKVSTPGAVPISWLILSISTNAANFLWTLERHVITIYTFYRTGNGTNLSILYYVVCEHLYVRHIVFRTIILESAVFKQFGFTAMQWHIDKAFNLS